MTGLYNCVEDDVIAVFNSGWTVPATPVFWRTNDLEVLPDPSSTPYFLRNTVLFGVETYLAFGSGRGANEKCLNGMVEIVGFASRFKVSERELLELLSIAMQAFRSKRVVGSYPGGSDLSFTGLASDFNVAPEESGNWFIRGARAAFEYRFVA